MFLGQNIIDLEQYYVEIICNLFVPLSNCISTLQTFILISTLAAILKI